jgi:flagellar biosynthesis/type III secretory pathway protein FliH
MTSHGDPSRCSGRQQEIYELEESQTMSYISNAERFGIEKGIEQGLLQGMREGTLIGLEKGLIKGESILLQKQLTRKFGPISFTIRNRIESADAETLLQWGEQLLDAKSIEEIFRD